MPSQIHPRGGAFSEEPLRRCKKQVDVWHGKLYSLLCGDLNGKDIRKGDICTQTADLLCYIAEANAAL